MRIRIEGKEIAGRKTRGRKNGQRKRKWEKEVGSLCKYGQSFLCSGDNISFGFTGGTESASNKLAEALFQGDQGLSVGSSLKPDHCRMRTLPWLGRSQARQK